MACSGRVFLSYGNVLLYFIGYSPDTTDSKIRTASACRKVDPLQYTSHLEASCKTLAELQEYESDRLIIHLVMIQNIVVKISNILNEPDGSPRSSTAPIKMYIKVSRSLVFFDLSGLSWARMLRMWSIPTESWGSSWICISAGTATRTRCFQAKPTKWSQAKPWVLQ